MTDEYDKARRKGQRCYQKYLLEGKYPYLQVLEEIISHTDVVSEQKLGLVQIPAELIVGTYSAGRRTAFAPNFMPLLSPSSEFASKWSALCKAHIDEGIRDPIKAIEFMNRYYVIEGNKRVSVLKFFDAVTIPGTVTRMVPRRTDEPENRLYFEYLDFNRKTGVNYLLFSEPGSYAEFEKLIGKTPDAEYTEDELKELRSAYVRFSKAYAEKCGDNPSVQPADAMLVYLQMYSYTELCEAMPSKLRVDIDKIWEDIQLLTKPQPAEIVTEPTEAPKKTLLERLLTPGSRKLKIAFIHEKNKETSAWTYSHELGRMYLEDEFGDRVETVCMDNISRGTSLEKALEEAVALKSDVIFTTTPQFLEASLKAAVKHPEVKILNCSVNPSHRYVRTYYARLFEAKLLAGMIAGSVSEDGVIGYIADYPISGMIANINAFAIGAKMVNPRAKVYLEWTSVTPVEQILQHFKEWGVGIVSTQEMVRLDADNPDSRLFGLVNLKNGEPENLAMAMWHWGEMYKKLVQSILDGGFKAEDTDGLAMGYWWGLNAGAIDLVCSKKVPEATRQLVELVRQNICNGEYHPFTGTLYTQETVIRQEEHEHLSPADIISMNWLAENVVGSLPEWETLNEEAKAVVDVQGVIPPEEELVQ